MNFSDLISRIASLAQLDTKRRMYRLEVEAKDVELLTIKDFVQRVCQAAGCASKEISNIKLALDEACSNIIRHAYKDIPDGKINLEIGVGYKDLRFKITDFGKAFDFRKIKDPDLNQYVDIGKKGGLGIWLIKKVMQRVDYRSYGSRNELTLYRKLTTAPPVELGLKGGVFSVSTKFTVGSVTLVLFLIVSAYFFFAHRQQSFVIKQQRDKVGLLLQTMAAQAGSSVAKKSDLELDHVIKQVLKQDEANVIDYALVVGTDKKILAHSDLSQLFKNFSIPAGAKPVTEAGVQSFQLRKDKGILTDYASTIYFKGAKVGEIHAGVSDEALLQLVEKIQSGSKRFIVGFFLASLLGLYFLSRIVIHPFQKILEGIYAISTGDLSTKLEVDTQDEFGLMANIFNEMTTRIQESQKGMVEQERLEKEMQVAQEIQHTLLPTEFPQIDGYEIGATYRSAKEVGGDYYDFFWVDPSTLGIVVADVSGKGIPGSMVMTMIRTAMRLEARDNKSAADVLSRVNSHVTGDMKKGMFVTMFYIILDSRKRIINFSSAGHNPMILYRSETQEVYFLKPKGFPVGIELPEEGMFAKSLALQKISLHKGDILVIYTDGITEAMNTRKDQYGEARLIQVIKENAHLTPAEFVNALNESIAQFTQGAEQNDDITVVAIKEKLKAENVVFKFRKKLIDLVEKRGLSVAEACRQMNISTNTYYHYKKIFDEKGHQGLKPSKAKGKKAIQELSLQQKQAVITLVREHPDYGAQLIAKSLKSRSDQPLSIDPQLINQYLKRKSLNSAEERKAFSLNEVDTL